ncbi:MAG: 5-formyltetrahydrofolate cyclo-ligase [Prevotellaceae bacterium]|jgi:5-formyltetrahydrofolate cyclo-ligase|nr:5-formyltetrahydrofolate cyclo-ligase [Prevotellaceae bacterium]
MLSSEKSTLRKEIRQRKFAFSADELHRKSSAILQKLEQHPLFIQAKTVLLYWSLPDEVYTHDFVERWSMQKTILLPIIIDDDIAPYLFDGKENMQSGCFSISEPATAVCEDEINLAIVPGIAFSPQGQRLGRGKGYYDRFLADFHGKKIGICFDFQLLPEIPVEQFDVKMDEVISN